MDDHGVLCFPPVQLAILGHDLIIIAVWVEIRSVGIVIGDLNLGMGGLRGNADIFLSSQLQTGGTERKVVSIIVSHTQVVALIGIAAGGAGIVVDLHLTIQIHVLAADAHTAAAGKGIAAELRFIGIDLDLAAAGGADIQRTLGIDTGALALVSGAARRADISRDGTVHYSRRSTAGVVQAAAVAASLPVTQPVRPGSVVQCLVTAEGAVLHGEGAPGVVYTAAALLVLEISLVVVVAEGHHRVVADGAILHDKRAPVEHAASAVVGAVFIGGLTDERHGVAGDGAVVHGELAPVDHTAAALKGYGVLADLTLVQVEFAIPADIHTAAATVAAVLDIGRVAGDLAAVHIERSSGNGHSAAIAAGMAGDAAAPQVEGGVVEVIAFSIPADAHTFARSLLAPVILAVGHRAVTLAIRQVEGTAVVHLDHAALVAVFADDAVSVQAQLHAVLGLPTVTGSTVFHLHVVQQVVIARFGDGLQAADARPCRLIVVGKVAAVGCIVTHAHAVGVGAVLRALHPQAAAAGRQRIRPIVAVESRLHIGIGMLHHKAGDDLRADADIALGGVKGAALHGAGVRAGVNIAIGFGIKANAHIVGRTVGQRVVLDTDDAASVDCRAVADDEALALIGGAVTVRGTAFAVHTAAVYVRPVAGDGTAMHNKAAGIAVYTAAVADGGVILDNAALLHGQHAAGHLHRAPVRVGTHMVLDDSAVLQRQKRITAQRKGRISGLHAAAVHCDVLQRQAGLVALVGTK